MAELGFKDLNLRLSPNPTEHTSALQLYCLLFGWQQIWVPRLARQATSMSKETDNGYVYLLWAGERQRVVEGTRGDSKQLLLSIAPAIAITYDLASLREMGTSKFYVYSWMLTLNVSSSSLRGPHGSNRLSIIVTVLLASSFFPKIFIYLAAPGLPCSTRDLQLWHVGSSSLTRGGT